MKAVIWVLKVLVGASLVAALAIGGNMIGYLISTQAAALAEKPACAEAACICRVGEAFACSRFSGIACAAWVQCPVFKEPCSEPSSPEFSSQLRK